MPGTDVASTIRLSVVGERGSLDLVVPRRTSVAQLASAYALQHGLDSPMTVRRGDGERVDLEQEVGGIGIADGAVLLAHPTSSTAADVAVEADREPGSRAGHWSRSGLPLIGLAAAAAAGAVYVMTGPTDSTTLRLAGAAVLALGALMCLLPAEAPDDAPEDSRNRRMLVIRDVAPGFAAAAAVAAAHLPGQGGGLSTLLVGALAAGVLATVGRAFTRHQHDEFLDVWLVTSCLVAVVGIIALASSGSVVPVAATLVGAGVLAVRLLPTVVVDVPDRVLVDVDWLAVTSWSARETPKPGRRNTMVPREVVAALVRRGQRLMLAGTVAATVATSASSVYLLVHTGFDARAVGTLSMIFLGGTGLALVARTVRASVPRTLMRLAGGVMTLGVGLAVLTRVSPLVSGVVVAGTLFLSTVVVIVAVALGQGWRSIWWARLADVAETACVILCVALVPLATGLFDSVRLWTST